MDLKTNIFNWSDQIIHFSASAIKLTEPDIKPAAQLLTKLTKLRINKQNFDLLLIESQGMQVNINLYMSFCRIASNPYKLFD